MKIAKTGSFSSIRLEEMDRVKLMNRTDTKYWFHEKHLSYLLEVVQENYFILNMNDEIALPYRTVYYDTTGNQMFTAHHNGKLNRFKIRRRSYVSSGISFLEVKFKTNKGRTIKKRVPAEFSITHFTRKEQEFIDKLTPFAGVKLHPSLINNFLRITLVNKNFKERCTIDFNIHFQTEDKNVSLDNLVIIEIKTEGKSTGSPLAIALREQRIKTSGFSKYCVGRAVTDTSLKRNAFKQKIRSIEKEIQTENNLYR